MKDILVFTRREDPYCLQAQDWQREVMLRHPEYEDIPLAVIDVDERPDLARQYRFTMLPAYFVGGQKICECPLKKERIDDVFSRAWSEPDTW